MLNGHKLVKKVNKSKEMKQAKELDFNEEGSAIISVGLKNADDFFSPFSYLSYELTNSDVIDYINMCEEPIPKNLQLSIDIYTEKLTSNEDKKRMKLSLKRYYSEKIVRLKHQQRKNLFFGLFYMIIGFLVLVLESIFFDALNFYHLSILFEVAGWVFLWDGLETIMGEWGNLGEQKKQCYHILSAKIHIRLYDSKIQKEYGLSKYEDET